MAKKAVFCVCRTALTFSNRYIGTKCKFHTASDDDDGIDGMTMTTLISAPVPSADDDARRVFATALQHGVRRAECRGS